MLIGSGIRVILTVSAQQRGYSVGIIDDRDL
jgi:hypothetical protein